MKFHLLFLFILCNLVSHAATLTWTGIGLPLTNAASWHLPSNWDTNSIPTAIDDVIIPPGSTIIVLTNSNAVAKSITCGSNNTSGIIDIIFKINGTLTLNQDYSKVYVYFTDFEITIFGTLDITSTSEAVIFRIQESIMNNNGNLFLHGYTYQGQGMNPIIAFQIHSNIIFNNAGTMSTDFNNTFSNEEWSVGLQFVGQGTTFTNLSTGTISLNNIAAIGIVDHNDIPHYTPNTQFINDGTVDIITSGNGGIVPGSGILSVNPGFCVINNGTITTTQNGTTPDPKYYWGPSTCNVNNSIFAMTLGSNNNASYSNGYMTLSNSSLLTGIGTISAQALSILCSVSPGNSPGVITFSDDFAQPNMTGFIMEIAGTAGAGLASGHDQIVFQGGSNTLLNNDLEVVLIDDFIPQFGDQFTIFSGTYDNNDNFGNIKLPGNNSIWTMSYSGTDITIELTDPNYVFYAVGIGISALPKAKFHVNGGDIYLEETSSGLIFKSPDGACWKYTMVGGILTNTNITCPDNF